MASITYTTDFRTLRLAYTEVKNFLEAESFDKVDSIHTKIVADLGMAGDDNWFMLGKFMNKYNLDETGLIYSEHFFYEHELFDSGEVLLQILVLPVRIVFLLIFLCSFGKINHLSKRLMPKWREVSDMTFGDMLTWYLVGTYNRRENVRVQLIPAI